MEAESGKLVRDKIPDIIRAGGHEPRVSVLDDEAYRRALVRKLAEECQEFTDALSLEELADVQEVVNALADHLASRGMLERVRAAKAAERGAFQEKLFLHKSSSK